jgi:hypothetical protein
MREVTIENYLVACVEARNGICLKLTAFPIVGWPDRTILLPGGRVAFAELKRPIGGRKGKLQPYWRNLLRRFGFKCEFLRTKDEVDAFVDSL